MIEKCRLIKWIMGEARQIENGGIQRCNLREAAITMKYEERKR